MAGLYPSMAGLPIVSATIMRICGGATSCVASYELWSRQYTYASVLRFIDSATNLSLEL